MEKDMNKVETKLDELGCYLWQHNDCYDVNNDTEILEMVEQWLRRNTSEVKSYIEDFVENKKMKRIAAIYNTCRNWFYGNDDDPCWNDGNCAKCWNELMPTKEEIL